MNTTGFPRPGLAMTALLLAFLLQTAGITTCYGIGTADDDMQVLNRGPIHEAFAEVSVDEMQPETVIRRNVPEPLNEIPPDDRPNGVNVQWIPGYWGWDEDLDDFIWISGVWRDVPPGRHWVPGYWVTIAGGSQYVSGYWADSRRAEATYLPPPPEPPPTAPAPPASASGNVWVEGHWLWSGNRYVWQAGSWQPQRMEMLWIPAHYSWTPHGYVFVPGYWDYLLVRRGVLYAPLYYPRPVYRASHYYYTPSVMLDNDVVFFSLYVRRDHHHYYFGDYHGDRYSRRGFSPWHSRHATRHGYDPHFTSYRWYHFRDDDRWEYTYRQQFDDHRHHPDSRPPLFHRDRQERSPDGERRYDHRGTDRNRGDIYRHSPDDRRHPQTRPERYHDDRQNQRDRRNDRPNHPRVPERVMAGNAPTPQAGPSPERRQDIRDIQDRPRPINQPQATPAVWQQQREHDRNRPERSGREHLQQDDGQPSARFRVRQPSPNGQQHASELAHGRQENQRPESPSQRNQQQRQVRQQRSPLELANQNYERTPPSEESTDQAGQLRPPQERGSQDGQSASASRPRWRYQQERVETK